VPQRDQDNAARVSGEETRHVNLAGLLVFAAEFVFIIAEPEESQTEAAR
jgi:hypothetical protein